MQKCTAGLLLAAVSAACGGGGEPGDAPASYPPGTVLAVSGAPISAAEVEAAAARVALVYPERAASFHVTTALQSLVLPRAALAHAFAEPHAAARAACEAARERCRAGEAPPASEHTGNWVKLSLSVWDAARGLEPGEWSDPLEDLGWFKLVRLEHRGGFERHPAEEVLTVSVLEFGYLPPAFGPLDLEQALVEARLEVVDPAYEELVPEALRYKMKGRKDQRSSP